MMICDIIMNYGCQPRHIIASTILTTYYYLHVECYYYKGYIVRCFITLTFALFNRLWNQNVTQFMF
jgi:hypothetical protein